MNTKIHPALKLIAICNLLSAICSSASAQDTAFTYQGRLFDSTNPANGNYALRFTLYDASNTLNLVSGPLTNAPVAISNGLFTVTLDFGPVFPGAPRWLLVESATNSVSPTYIPMNPRQQLTPAPYAIFATTASNLTGTLPTAQLSGAIPTTQLSGLVSNSQLANTTITITPGAGLGGGGAVALGGSTSLAIPSGAVNNSMLANPSLTVSAGTGLSGGGATALGGSTTLNNSGVLSVTGNADVTASTVNGVVTLGDTATSLNVASTIVKRDGTGNFAAGNATLSGSLTAVTATLSGNLNLPVTIASAGIINSGGSPFVHAYGNNNFFGGVNAGNLTLNAGGDTGIGWGALRNVTTGNNNTAIGYLALTANTSGGANTAVGVQALLSNTNGRNNTASGYQALNRNNADENTATGFQALYANTSGGENVANGNQALYNNLDGYQNTASGVQALYTNTSGFHNVASGFQALYNNTSSDNTAIGYWALYNNTGGTENSANGAFAMLKNASGFDNAANGAYAMQNNTSGSHNTASGHAALLANTSGSNNTACGDQTLFSVISGSYNTADGAGALQSLTSGSYNIALGATAGAGVFSGSDNIYIGNFGLVPTENRLIRIGSDQTNTFIAGIYGTTVSGSAVVVNSSGQLGVAPSSRRFKENIRNMADTSDVLLSLRPVTFRYKPGIDPKGLPQFGLIAEEVEKVDPNLVQRDAKGEVYTVRYEAVNVMLLNEFQKEYHKVREQELRLTSQCTEIRDLKLQLAATQLETAARLSQLEKALARITDKSATTLAAAPAATVEK